MSAIGDGNREMLLELAANENDPEKLREYVRLACDSWKFMEQLYERAEESVSKFLGGRVKEEACPQA